MQIVEISHCGNNIQTAIPMINQTGAQPSLMLSRQKAVYAEIVRLQENEQGSFS
jgi:hypothetical protein